MRYKKILLVLLFIMSSVHVFCQDDINRKNSNGRKDGYWLYLKHDKSISFTHLESTFPINKYHGLYDDGIKLGTWFLHDYRGFLLKEEIYSGVQDTLFTEVNYYDNNVVKSKGKRLIIQTNDIDTTVSIDPLTGYETVKIDYKTYNKEIGEWKYYYPDGRLRKTEYYK